MDSNSQHLSVWNKNSFFDYCLIKQIKLKKKLKRQETIRYLNLENPNTLCFLNSSINALIQSDSVYNLLTDSSIDNQNDDVNDIIKELRLLISGQINNASKLSTLLGFNEGKQEDAAIPLEFMLDNCTGCQILRDTTLKKVSWHILVSSKTPLTFISKCRPRWMEINAWRKTS